MTATIHYETASGTDSIERDEYHDEKTGFIVSYDWTDSDELVNKTLIPIERVVRIDG